MTQWIAVSGRYFLPDGCLLSKKLTKFVMAADSLTLLDNGLDFTVCSVIQRNRKSFFVTGIQLLEEVSERL